MKYALKYWRSFDYKELKKARMLTRYNQREKPTVNDAILFLDTETSKSKNEQNNHIVIWTLTIRMYHKNLVTLYGRKPSECASCLSTIQEAFKGLQTFIYIHNLSYDWIFLRKFFFEEFGYPTYQLNTKSLYPIHIEFANGIILKDSLILAQRSLDKWASDLKVKHRKAVGYWDYDLIRNQDTPLTRNELHYAEYDTLAGAECIDVMMTTLNHKIYAMPWTATGIPRENVRKIGNKHNAHKNFLNQAFTINQLLQGKQTYHGGYVHGNRALYGITINDLIKAYDFASSYPFCMLAFKFPTEGFTEMPNCSINDILDDQENAYMFKLIGIGVRLKDYRYPMPALQFSKCVKCVNPIVDNGRILEADYIEIYLTEIDLEVIVEMYTFYQHICVDVLAAFKTYLPRWFTDYIYQLFSDKCTLKNGDPVLYAIAKSKLNSCYGLTVQFPVKDDIKENYETGEYEIQRVNMAEKYEEFCQKRSTVLNYQIGIWVTAYAFRNLFKLGSCAGTWIYSDTDSCYGVNWDEEAVASYNKECKQKLLANDYGPVIHNGREYWLGIAELDGVYSQMRVIGAKRYCVRKAKEIKHSGQYYGRIGYKGLDMPVGDLKITVAGVPKKTGAACLDNDIENFRSGFIFSGEKTGKKLHTHLYVDDIYIDENENEVGDSIDLSPCDYLLSDVKQWENITDMYYESEEYFTDE